MNKYARIGRPCLIQAIGPQKNHTETVLRDTENIDRDRYCCYTCPHYAGMHMEHYSSMPDKAKEQMDYVCRNCPCCAFKKESVTRYVNEQNRYGYGVRLGLVATKLLIFCHFEGPDKNGLVKYIHISDAMQAIGCSRRSVLNAIEKLEEHGYILSGKCGRGVINVLIPSYKDIGLPAEKGGRGYITVNQDMFSRLMECDQITQLRVMVRILLDSDTSKDGTATEEINVFRRFLPSYCKPGIIRKALDKTGFQLFFKDNGAVKIKLDKQSCGRICYQEEFKKSLSGLKEHVSMIVSDMESANRKTVAHKSNSQERRRLKKSGYTLDTGVNGMKFYVPFKFSDQDFSDLANVAVSFSVEEVKKALAFIYQHYNMVFKPYQAGALVRSLLKAEEIPSFT